MILGKMRKGAGKQLGVTVHLFLSEGSLQFFFRVPQWARFKGRTNMWTKKRESCGIKFRKKKNDNAKKGPNPMPSQYQPISGVMWQGWGGCRLNENGKRRRGEEQNKCVSVPSLYGKRRSNKAPRAVYSYD